MAFIKNTDVLVEGSINQFFSNERAKSAVQSDLNSLSGSITGEQAARQSDVSGLDSRLDSLEADPVTKTYVDGQASGLDARLDIIEGASGQEGSIAKALVDAKAYTDQEVAALVDSAPEVLNTLKELSDALSGDASFASTIAGQIGSLSGAISSEIGNRQADVSGLDARIDSLEADPVTKSYVDGAASGLDSRLDALEADPTTKAYVDGAISGEQSARSSADQALSGAITGEAAARQADVSGLDARLDSLEADPVTKSYVDGAASGLDARLDSLEADPTTKAYVDGAVSGEQSARQSADQALSGAITGEEAARQADVSGLDARLDSLEADPTTKAYVDGQVSGLDSRLDSLEADPVTKAYVDGEASGLDARLDIIEGPSGQAGSIAKALVDAKAYTDQEVAALVDSAPEVLNTLKELADALSGDATFAQTVAGQIGSLSGSISTEIGNRQSDVSGLDARLDALEADPVTKSYVDGEVSGLDARIDALEADDTTKAYVDGQVSGLDARLDALEADPVTKAYVDGAISGEQSARQSADQALSGAITGEEAARQADVSGLDSRLDALEADPTTKAYVDGQVSGLDSRIDALEADPVTKTYVDGQVSGLDARLDIIEGPSGQAGSIAKALVDAEAFAQELAVDYGSGLSVFSSNTSLNFETTHAGLRVAVVSVSGGAVQITLPAASGAEGRYFKVKDSGSSVASGNFITVVAQSGQTVDGASGFQMKMPYESAEFFCDGDEWFVM